MKEGNKNGNSNGRLEDLGSPTILRGVVGDKSTVVLPNEVGEHVLRTGQVYTMQDGAYTARVQQPTKKGVYVQLSER